MVEKNNANIQALCKTFEVKEFPAFCEQYNCMLFL